MRGKLATVIDRIGVGHHVFRAYFKNAFLKQYEKFSTFLRNELVSNNLADFRLKKELDHLDAVRERFQTITGRFAGFQAQWLNVHVDFPLLQRLALPITVGTVRYPGIEIHDPRIIRLFEVLLHGGGHVGGWTAKQIHQAVLTTFHLSDATYRLNQLRYDLRRLKGHALLQRDGSRYAYRLTPRGSTSPSSSCSSTNGSAARSPTAAFTTALTSITSRPANSKPPTTTPIKPFSTSSISLPPNVPVAIVQLFLSQISALESKLRRGNAALRIGDPGPMERILISGEPGNDFVAALCPLPGEPVSKPGKGALFATGLDALLRARRATHLAIAGVTTEVCVQTTMREANDRGYECLLVEDATESYFPEFKAATLAMIRAPGCDRRLDGDRRPGARGSRRTVTGWNTARSRLRP